MSTPAVDFSVLEKIAELTGANRASFAAHVVEVFLSRIEEARVEVTQALARDDARLIWERAHEIASSSAQVGASLLASACRRLEADARVPGSDLTAAVKDFLAELDAARDALSAHFFGAGSGWAASIPRILIVDDDRTTSLILSRLLERSGYAVEAVADGLAALERLESIEFDALITDLRMPQMSGRELCEQVRSQDRWRDLPIFLTTGMPESDQLGWLKSLAGVELLEKPIVIAVLIRRLDRILRPSTPR